LIGRSKKIVVPAVLVAATLIAAMLTVGRSEFEEIVANPAPAGTPATGSETLSKREQAFYDEVVPRMLKVTAEAQVLDKLGQEKSRNVLELQTRGNRIDSETAAINAFIAQNSVPQRFQPAMATFEQGVSDLNSAMSNSKKGMVAFNWDLVAQQIAVFDQGAAKVKAATDQIQKVAATATPELY
jgi:hypothetical protein